MARSIKLESSDGLVFEVEKAVALEFTSIKHNFEGDEFAAAIPISVPNVTGQILGMIIDYCTKHAGSEADDEDLEAFDANFVRVEESTLLGLCVGAYHLNIQSLCNLACKAVARVLEGKTVAAARSMLNIHVTAEEDEEIQGRAEEEFRRSAEKV